MSPPLPVRPSNSSVRFWGGLFIFFWSLGFWGFFDTLIFLEYIDLIYEAVNLVIS